MYIFFFGSFSKGLKCDQPIDFSAALKDRVQRKLWVKLLSIYLLIPTHPPPPDPNVAALGPMHSLKSGPHNFVNSDPWFGGLCQLWNVITKFFQLLDDKKNCKGRTTQAARSCSKLKKSINLYCFGLRNPTKLSSKCPHRKVKLRSIPWHIFFMILWYKLINIEESYSSTVALARGLRNAKSAPLTQNAHKVTLSQSLTSRHLREEWLHS